jgi:hypothetical protein
MTLEKETGERVMETNKLRISVITAFLFMVLIPLCLADEGKIKLGLSIELPASPREVERQAERWMKSEFTALGDVAIVEILDGDVNLAVLVSVSKLKNGDVGYYEASWSFDTNALHPELESYLRRSLKDYEFDVASSMLEFSHYTIHAKWMIRKTDLKELCQTIVADIDVKILEQYRAGTPWYQMMVEDYDEERGAVIL